MRCSDREMAEVSKGKEGGGYVFRAAGHRVIIIIVSGLQAAAHLSNRGIAARASKKRSKRDGRACLIY